MDKIDALEFCAEWLPSWTGNRPQELISFYAENAVFVDPVNREGLRGHEEILAYFEKLLHSNPYWVWEAIEVFPIDKGFVLKWQAEIPVNNITLTERGLDIVEIQNGLITRNEVYFDRSQLVTLLFEQRLMQLSQQT